MNGSRSAVALVVTTRVYADITARVTVRTVPYPADDDPLRCPRSRGPLPDDRDLDALWHRCPDCGRLIAEMGGTGLFHAHKTVPGRRRDAVQENLHAAGWNRKERFTESTVFADPETSAART